MNSRRESLRRLPASALAPLLAAVIISTSAVAAEVAPGSDQSPTATFESTTIEVGADVAGVSIEIPRVDRVIDNVRRVEVDLPVDHPSLLVGVGPDDRIDALALTTGNGDRVLLSSRSTAATLVALSPGVLTDDASWPGIVGHVVATDAFEELVATLERVADVRDADVRAALAVVVDAARPDPATACGWVCAERSADGSSLVIESSSLGPVVIMAGARTVCGVAQGGERIPAAGAEELGLSALGGRALPGDVALPRLQTKPSFTRLELPSGCDGPLDAVGPGDRAGFGPTLALVTARLTEHADALIDLLWPEAIAAEAQVLHDHASDLTSRGETSSLDTLADLEQLRGVDDPLGARLLDLTSEGLLTPRLPAIELVIAVRGESPATTTTTAPSSTSSTTTTMTSTTTGQVTAPRSTIAPVFSPPATSAGTPVVVTSPTQPSVAPTTTAAPTTTLGVLSVSMSTTFATPPDEGQWSVSVSVTNTGARTIDLSGTGWSMVDQSTNAAVAILSIDGLTSGELRPGAALSGTIVVQVTGGGPYELVWSLEGGAQTSVVMA